LSIDIYVSIFGRVEEAKKRGIQIYGCCPGYVKTDMTSHKGILTLDQGILTPIFLAELPFEFKEEIQGSFFYEQKKISLFE
jgi:NAD(P)-dependent dehydrogenase (short-subunit alcohol dehydrogenase family)